MLIEKSTYKNFYMDLKICIRNNLELTKNQISKLNSTSLIGMSFGSYKNT